MARRAPPEDRFRGRPRPRVAALLREILRTGSLRKAARTLGMAPGNAHRVIRSEERRLGHRLLRGSAGGRAGGGSRLTPAGRRLARDRRASTVVATTWWPGRLAVAPAAGSPLQVIVPDARVTAFVAPLEPGLGTIERFRAGTAIELGIAPDAATVLPHTARVRSSARNRWPARIVRIRGPGIHGVQVVELGVGAKTLLASVTPAAVRQLRLRPGLLVRVHVKATALRLRVPSG